MREKMVRSDIVEAVIGLGANLFFNSPMEACILICRTSKPSSRIGRVLFVDASTEVTRRNAQSFLEDGHIDKIAEAYAKDASIEGFSSFATIDEIASKEFSLSIPLYVRNESNVVANGEAAALPDAIGSWEAARTLRREAFGAVRDYLIENGGDPRE